MKQIFLFATLAAGLLATSCDNKSDSYTDVPEGYYFATVMEVGAEPATDQDTPQDDDDAAEVELYFLLDSQESFIVTENVSKIEIEELTIGARVIAGATLEKNTDDTYNYTAKLYDAAVVVVGESVEVTTQEEDEAVANDAFAAVSTGITLTQGYLNLYVSITSEDVESAKFYLVENTFTENDDAKEDYLSLELRFDSAGEEGKGTKYNKYLSFDMSEYQEKLEGKDGVQLRIKTKTNESVTVEVDSKNLFPELS
ncbi:MAG: NigD-like C-terminal domain-containing protein [Rikenellaceae bacterium]